MIRIGFLATALGAALLLGGCFGDDTPQQTLEKVQAIQAKQHPMTERQKKEVDAALAEGRAALAAGKSEVARAAFGRALTVMQRVEDIALFNKSE